MGAGFNSGAYEKIYKHEKWQTTANRYEEKFAAKLYHTPYVQDAAKTALVKLSTMLNQYYGRRAQQDGTEAASADRTVQDTAATLQAAADVTGQRVEITDILKEALLPQGDSSTGAGQIGNYASHLTDQSNAMDRRVAEETDTANLDAVINGDGNLRERMTMLYNGMFINGGKSKSQIAQSRSLKNMMAYATPEDAAQLESLQGMRFDILEGMSHRKSRDDVFDTFSMAREMHSREEELEGKGNWFTRGWRGLKRAFNAAFLSKFIRKSRSAEERKKSGLGEAHYNDLGIGLSRRERINGMHTEITRGEDGTETLQQRLMWQEGQAYYKMKSPMTGKGMLQTAGPSGTTLRMLGAYKLMGASNEDLLKFRLALIAWMVSSHDHSLYEILDGSHNAGVKGKEDLSEPATMYMTVDPIPVDILRADFAEERQFPHEIIYRIMLNELRDKRKAAMTARNRKRRSKDKETDDLAMEKTALSDSIKQFKTEIKRLTQECADHKVTSGTVAGALKTTVGKTCGRLIGILGKEHKSEISALMIPSPFKYLTREVGAPEEAETGEQASEGQAPAAARGDRRRHDKIDVGVAISPEMAERATSIIRMARENGLSREADDIAAKWTEIEAFCREYHNKLTMLDVFREQLKYMEGEERTRKIALSAKGYENSEDDLFTLFGKSKEGVMSSIGDDATKAEAQDVALNIYTTGAFLSMTRGMKYGAMMAKSAMSDSRVDAYRATGFGSYEFSSSSEAGDSSVSGDIYDMIRMSSRMSQDALQERGITGAYKSETAPESPDGTPTSEYAKTYRGGRLSGGYGSGEGSEIEVNSLTSSSKYAVHAGDYYRKSVTKDGEDKAVMIEYLMTGKGAVDISGVSKAQLEGEVLIPAGSRFRITQAIQNAYVTPEGITYYGENPVPAGLVRDKEHFVCKAVQVEEVEGPGEKVRQKESQLSRNIRTFHDQRRAALNPAAAGGSGQAARGPRAVASRYAAPSQRQTGQRRQRRGTPTTTTQ